MKAKQEGKGSFVNRNSRGAVALSREDAKHRKCDLRGLSKQNMIHSQFLIN